LGCRLTEYDPKKTKEGGERGEDGSGQEKKKLGLKVLGSLKVKGETCGGIKNRVKGEKKKKDAGGVE